MTSWSDNESFSTVLSYLKMSLNGFGLGIKVLSSFLTSWASITISDLLFSVFIWTYPGIFSSIYRTSEIKNDFDFIDVSNTNAQISLSHDHEGN